jgi:tetratricopeptide (TPR) repeat protein
VYCCRHSLSRQQASSPPPATDAEWKAKGNAALGAGNNTEAIACYTRAIALDGTQHTFFSNRSAAYLSNGQAAEALADAETCIGINGTWAKGFSRKGAALHALRKYDEATAAYKEGLVIDPANAGLKSGLAEVGAAQKSSATVGGCIKRFSLVSRPPPLLPPLMRVLLPSLPLLSAGLLPSSRH